MQTPVRQTIYLCKVTDIPVNGARRFGLPDRPGIAVFNLGGQFYATQDRCTHGDASLSNGEIEDRLVICPLHFGSFDIMTGAAVDAPCSAPLEVFDLVLRDGGLYLRGEDER